ncbi:MAG: PAS domain-containing protein, partial [Sphingomonas sp.]
MAAWRSPARCRGSRLRNRATLPGPHAASHGRSPRPTPFRTRAAQTIPSFDAIVLRENSMQQLIGSVAPASATLVSLCEFRLRSNRALPDTSDEDYEPLASVIREVGRELTADGVLVAWHTPDRAPTFLFASGACEPQSDAEHDMLEAACEAATRHPAPVSWAARDREPDTDALLIASIPADSGVITMTALFRRISMSGKIGVRDAATRMLPMVQGIFRLWSQKTRALARNRGLTAALNSSDVATLLVDAGGKLVFANAAAERLLGKGDGLRRAGAMLGGTRLADTIRLHASIEHVAHGGGGTPAPVVALNRTSGRPLLAAIVAAEPAANAVDVAAIVHVFDPD